MMAEAALKRKQSLTVENSDSTDMPPPKKGSQKPDKSPVEKPASSQAGTSVVAQKTQVRSSSVSNEAHSTKHDKFHNDIMKILETINKNQTIQENRLQRIETKLTEYEEPYDCGNDECYVDETEQFSLVDDQSSELQAVKDTESFSSDSVFEDIFKKYNVVDEVDGPINSHLATLVNKVFREGISEEKFQKLLKDTHRPENCETLIKTRVNNLVWNLLSPQIHTIDSNMQKIQESVIKAAIIITKLISSSSSQLDETQIETGTDALGLLGQANKLINVRRKELHKSNLNPEFHYLCSPSQKFTDFLYGDDISKHVKEIQDVNKIGTRIKGSSQRGAYGYGNQYRGRGRFRGVYRGRVTKARGRGRGSYTPSKSKNQSVEHSKK